MRSGTSGESADLREIRAVAPTRAGETTRGFARVQRFLERFGYMSTVESSEGALDSATSDALAQFQLLHSLDATGEFDEATREQMTRPRCALPDLGAGVEFATMCAWQRSSLTYALESWDRGATAQGGWEGVIAAFATWERLGAVTFRPVEVTSNPDVLVGWRPADDPDFAMAGGTIAHADFPPGCGIVTSTLPKPIHFDYTEHAWSMGTARMAFDLETVALHEIGHILGLAHSASPEAVMRPIISPNASRRELGQDDVGGFNALYPNRIVPDVRGMTLTEAVDALGRVGLSAMATSSTDEVSPLSRQFPAPGSKVHVGTSVRLQG